MKAKSSCRLPLSSAEMSAVKRLKKREKKKNHQYISVVDASRVQQSDIQSKNCRLYLGQWLHPDTFNITQSSLKKQTKKAKTDVHFHFCFIYLYSIIHLSIHSPIQPVCMPTSPALRGRRSIAPAVLG